MVIRRRLARVLVGLPAPKIFLRFKHVHQLSKSLISGHDSERQRSLTSSASSDRNPNDGAFGYDKLVGHGAIRLLILHPAAYQEEIRITLRKGNLYEDTYQALSYVWNDPYSQRIVGQDIVTVISNETGQRQSITANLYLALRHLRSASVEQLLWVDALCINQRDTAERGQQVSIMGAIYSSAAEVVVWLGEHDKWTAGAAATIQKWAKLYGGHKVIHQPTLLRDLLKSGTFEEEQAHFEALIRRSWFTRAWTFQELCLSRKTVLRCGFLSLPWQTFHDACSTIISAGQKHFIFEENTNLETIYAFWNMAKELPSSKSQNPDRNFSLSNLLRETRLYEASDPRDKVFSMLGLADPPVKNKAAFTPDYNISEQEVYCHFTRAMIMEDASLNVLSSKTKARSNTPLLLLALSRGIKPTPNLPSWVPDFQDHDCVEYVARDENIQWGSADSQRRTRFPQLLANERIKGSPRYRVNLKCSDDMKGDFTFNVGDSPDPRKLGVYGTKVDTIVAVVKLDDEVTEDPHVKFSMPSESRTPGVSSVNTRDKYHPLPPRKGSDWRTIFRACCDAEGLLRRLVNGNDYKPTGEAPPIAIIRALTADLLPISKRITLESKQTDFPRHFDWHFWHERFLEPSKWTEEGPILALLKSCRSFRRIQKAKSKRVKEDVKVNETAWTAFDDKPLRKPHKVYKLYEELLTGRSLMGPTFRKTVSYLETATLMILLSIAGVPPISGAGLLTTFAVVAIPTIVLRTLHSFQADHARPMEANPTLPNRLRNLTPPADANDVTNYEWEMACEVQNAINHASWNREFFVTKEGYIGIGPVGMQAGDEVYALIGGQVPFVLRPRNQNEPALEQIGLEEPAVEFELLAECYMHGIMDGEIWRREHRWWRWGWRWRNLSLEEMKSKARKVVLV